MFVVCGENAPAVERSASPLARKNRRVAGIGRIVLMALFMGCHLHSGYSQPVPAYEQSPIHYSQTETHNRADVFGVRFADETNARADRGRLGMLKSMLEEFEVSAESQVLVFSRTSLQRDRIFPDRPRAVYFSDDAYVGYVQNGLLELTITDPKLGIVFYAIDPGARSVTRSRDCLSCHGGSRTGDWPGVFVRSIFPDATGDVITSMGSYVTSHSSPFEERWGGWYVTGQHGDSRHLGNAIARETDAGAEIDSEPGSNVTDLSKYFDTGDYLRPDSDIVALMVLEHQCEMHNRLSRGMLRTQRWLDYQRVLNEAMGEETGEEPSGSAKRVIDSESERIVEYMLFCGEERMPRGGIAGTGDFEEAFRKNRREDSSGRSLKDFELNRRLFRYRCSYMIYSEAFDILPMPLKQRVVQRLFELLSMDEMPEKYEHLHARERQNIREILLETKPEFRELLAKGK